MESSIPSYLKINKALLGMFGLWPHQNIFTKILLSLVLIFFTSTQTIFQIWGALLAREEWELFLETIPNILAGFSIFAKMGNFFFNNHRMKKLLEQLEDDWRELKSSAEKEILNEYGVSARKFTLTYLGIMWGTMTPFLVVPAVPLVINIFLPNNETLPRQMLFVQYEYLFDLKKYYYPVIIHSWIGTCVFMNIVVALDTTCMVYVEHAAALFRCVGHNLNEIENTDEIKFDVNPKLSDDKAHKEIGQCMKLHNRVLKYSELIEDAHYISYFFQLGIMMICMTFTGFQIATKIHTAPDVSIRFAAMSSSQLAIMLFQGFIQGQQLFDSSAQVYHDIYNSKWYNTSMRTRKIQNLMSIRASKPCQLTAGRFYILSYENYGIVVKTAMSYVMVLLSMEEED